MCLPGCAAAVTRALDRRGFFTGAAAAFTATAIAPAAAEAAPRRFSRVIDLSHTMSAEFPSYFGVPGIEMQRQTDIKKDGYNSYWWRIFEHAGTHLDAPLHFTQDGMSADAIPADALVVPLAVIDVAFKAEQNADYLLAREDIANWEKRHGRLPERCCVAMHSGWARHAAANPGKFTGRDISGTYHFPGVSPQAAEWLMKERSVVGLAVDTLSLDNGPSKDFKTHYLWLPSGRWGLENIANLDKVPAANATLVVGAPKVKDATGGLTRVMALV